jgi:ribosomal protein L24
MREWTVGEDVEVISGKHKGGRGVVTRVTPVMLEVTDQESGIASRSWKTSCRRIAQLTRPG